MRKYAAVVATQNQCQISFPDSAAKSASTGETLIQTASGSGGPLDPDQVNSLATWAMQVNSVPMLAALMHEMFCDHDEDEE